MVAVSTSYFTTLTVAPTHYFTLQVKQPIISITDSSSNIYSLLFSVSFWCSHIAVLCLPAMDSDYDYGYGDYSSYSSYGSYGSNDDYDNGYEDGYDDGYKDGYGDRYDDSDGYDYHGYDGSYRDYIDGYKDYTDSYKHYIDSYEDYINDSKYKDDGEDDAGYVLADRDSTEAVFGDGGCGEDYDHGDEVYGNGIHGYGVYDNGLYHNACGATDRNLVYGNEVYKNEACKPYRGVYRNGTRRNAIYTNEPHSKIYNHHEPEKNSGGYIKNDLYMPHRTGRYSHKHATTGDDQMDIRLRRLDMAKETCSKLCGGRFEMFPKQR